MSPEYVGNQTTDAISEDLFEPTMRGYNKRQVEEYVKQMTAELSTAREEAYMARAQADEAAATIGQLREELTKMHHSSTASPDHEKVSGRLAEILRLADEEAEQRRTRATEEASASVQSAKEESEKITEEARSVAEGIISTARAQSETDAANAKAEVETLLANAASSSQATLTDAEYRAAQVLAHADQRTSTLAALQDERMVALRNVHTDTLRRLESVRSLLEQILTVEAEAGAPDYNLDHTPIPPAGSALRATDVPGAPTEIQAKNAVHLDATPQDTDQQGTGTLRKTAPHGSPDITSGRQDAESEPLIPVNESEATLTANRVVNAEPSPRIGDRPEDESLFEPTTGDPSRHLTNNDGSSYVATAKN